MTTYSAPTDLTGDIPNETTPLVGVLTWQPAVEPGTTPLLLLHFDGIDGQTTTVDSSPFNWPVTIPAFVGLELTTSDPKFGTASLAIPSTNPAIPPGNNLVTVPIDSGGPLDIFAQGVWTIQCWSMITSNDKSGNVHVVAYGDTAGGNPNNRALVIQYANFNGTTATLQALNAFAFPSASGGLSGTVDITVNTWHHIALVNDGSETKLYFDGAQVGTMIVNWTPANYTTAPGLLVDIGMYTNYAGGDETSQIDEFAVYPSALWTAPFTPPTQAFSGSGTVAPGYDVYRDGVSIATFTGGPGYTDTVPAEGTYTYTVAAWDGTSDVSDLSDPFTLNYEAGIVPNLVNTSFSTVAPALLSAAGLLFGTVTHQVSGVVIAGNIISQSPAAGTVLALGSGVSVVVSSGLPPLTVPDLFEMTQADATALLLSLGFVVGAVGSQPSNLIPAGTVMLQNPTAGTPLPPGSIVSFVLSTGEPATSTLFDFEATVISQYANSPTIMQLVANLNQYIDQSANFANFYNYIWNIDSAVGFGLDIWGVIVGVSRLLNIPTGVKYVGFYQSTESQPDQDWTPAGSNQPPYNDPPVGGAMYTGYNATTAYLLPDDAYRQLILAKAFANICTTTAPAINQILQNLYGAGTAFVLNTGRMAISYNLTFTPTPIQLAILEQSGVIPTPPGVAVTINTNV